MIVPVVLALDRSRRRCRSICGSISGLGCRGAHKVAQGAASPVSPCTRGTCTSMCCVALEPAC
ncbi:MAG: hypothetical protein CVV14_13005 [Gammaproteobacteria bacterium HGW-Gammaproteobacteria-4]|nr:MAG: hypothetical protein CVV16_13210 [Gammaproteobacteria bacterium HGW-Gammaproteobacteria-6]PKM06386.1 MAG: hypothetical protein CVV14_13005 [Gammaproteobacteria bacterium HGW-Gammaproteobacteria-4]